MTLRLINKLRANLRHGLLATVNTGGARPIHLTNRSKEGACPNPVPMCPACLKGRDWDRGGGKSFYPKDLFNECVPSSLLSLLERLFHLPDRCTCDRSQPDFLCPFD